ncbi:hypothetical protein CRE_18766 [Caenorhabditis remanei]|uniref:Uncharacterized protein n=1 Tax=Caenorhabditis remanei TaxID=31234 RepID=E3LK40_CAERE|nr:hypothetical protein CRE_18766 [Caenorhabditis remanei]
MPAHLIEVVRNPNYRPEAPRPIKYYMCQITELFQKAAPEMTQEQTLILSKIQGSISSANHHFAKQAEEQCKQREAEAVESQNSFESDMNARVAELNTALPVFESEENDSLQMIEEGIRLTHQITYKKNMLENIKEFQMGAFANKCKLDLGIEYETRKLNMTQDMEIMELQNELDNLAIDLALKS